MERRTGVPRYRALLGASMGRLNTQLRALAARTGADPKLLFGLWLVSRPYVQSEQDWRPLYGGHCAVDVASVAERLLAP